MGKAFDRIGTAFAGLLLLVNVGPQARAAGFATGHEREHVSLTVLTCPKAVALKTTPTATLGKVGEDKLEVVSMGHPIPEEYNANLELTPGHYYVRAQDGFCRGSIDFTVLPAHSRDLGLILNTRTTMYDTNASLAGTLPIGGIAKATLTPASQAISADDEGFPVTLDRGAYYGENLVKGNYILSLYFVGQSLVCRIPVAVNGRGTVFDVKMSDITASIGYFVRVIGKPVEFYHLWSSKVIY